MFDFLNGPADEVAARLLGCELVRRVDGRVLRGRIVETEAYDQTDAASHSYRGQTPRTDVMFGSAGRLYVYFTYGMHYCCNIVTGDRGHGSAVLIRALEPLEGQAAMAGRRHKPADSLELTNGPAKLCQALVIDRRLNGYNVVGHSASNKTAPTEEMDGPAGGLWLLVGQPVLTEHIVQTTRVGISRAKDVLWRFYIRGNRYVSKV
jgi:DNA-3-methyladenine glycosylase